MLGGFSLAQDRLTIENERRSGDTNSPGTTDRVVTFAESARLQADPAMRGRIKGFLGGSPDKAELRLRRFGGDHWQPFAEHIVLPEPPCLLTLDGSDLWLGGSGYIVAFNLDQNKIRASCNLAARSIDRLQVAGGYLWAQYDRHLHRARLP